MDGDSDDAVFVIGDAKFCGIEFPLYLAVRAGQSNKKVARTVSVIDGLVMADVNDDGHLLGIEILGPCRLDLRNAIAHSEE